MKPREIDYFNSCYIPMWVDRSLRRGGGTIFKKDHDVVTFRGANYVLRSDNNGFKPAIAGRYRMAVLRDHRFSAMFGMCWGLTGRS